MRPIDADALLKLYKGWLPQLSSEYDFGDKRGVETCIAVLEDAPTIEQPQWISVEERLPEPHENPVLGVFFGIVNPAWCYGGLWELPSGLITDKVTHWMPLPQPPKGVE